MQPLEDDLHCELDVASFARADSRSTVEVANGVTHQTESGRAEVRRAPVRGEILGAYIPIGGSGSKRGDGSNAGGQIDSVEKVKEICPELDFDPFGNRDVFDERQVYIAVARGIPFVPRDVPVRRG